HSLLAYMGLARGHRTVAEAVSDVRLRLALERYWDLAAALLPAGEDLDLDRYRGQLLERFANPRIGYPLEVIAADGLDKLRSRVLPVIAAARRAGRSPEPALAVTRAWARWLAGDPARAASDQNQALLEPVLAAGRGAEQIRELLALLAAES
ncbi:MAG: mannitol dehydrogenase family protein, partial [Solirubrobacteraceae bacterium]